MIKKCPIFVSSSGQFLICIVKVVHTLVWMCSQKYSNLETYLIYRYKTTAGSDGRYINYLIAGYAVPLLFVILTGIVEGTAPRCSLYKPRFLDKSCFFAGMYVLEVPLVCLYSSN